MYAGYDVPIHYDPMIAKLIVWGRDRLDAIDRMKRALGECSLTGIRTTIPFFIEVMRHDVFRSGVYNTGYVAEHLGTSLKIDEGKHEELAAIAAALATWKADMDRANRAPDTDGAGGPKNLWSMAGRLSRLGRV